MLIYCILEQLLRFIFPPIFKIWLNVSKRTLYSVSQRSFRFRFYSNDSSRRSKPSDNIQSRRAIEFASRSVRREGVAGSRVVAPFEENNTSRCNISPVSEDIAPSDSSRPGGVSTRVLLPAFPSGRQLTRVIERFPITLESCPPRQSRGDPRTESPPRERCHIFSGGANNRTRAAQGRGTTSYGRVCAKIVAPKPAPAYIEFVFGELPPHWKPGSMKCFLPSPSAEPANFTTLYGDLFIPFEPFPLAPSPFQPPSVLSHALYVTRRRERLFLLLGVRRRRGVSDFVMCRSDFVMREACNLSPEK